MVNVPVSSERRVVTGDRRRTPKPVLIVLTVLVVSVGVGLALIVVFALGLGLFGAGSASYDSVLSPATDWRMVTAQVDREVPELGSVPEFVIQDGALYLRHQTVRHGMLATWVSHGDWSIAKLREFRFRNPELESYWPEPAARNAGVAWIPWR